MNLKKTITNLIYSKREGDYWDFKEEPHANNASLLHDILCLSNSLHGGERYLILGVSDPKSGCQIRGLLQGQANRKEQSQLIDFLRSKKFAGDLRPEIELRTIFHDNKEIDVLIIYDNPYKPYYVTEDFRDRDKKVSAFHIYGRINDTNTPLTKSADLTHIEKMWRQRFGLQLSPVEKMKLLLTKPEEWFKDIGNKSVAYHIQHPEYTIKFSEVRPFSEPYTLFYTNETAFLGRASFRYHATELFELEYMYCDEMRITLPVPEIQSIQFSDSKHWFYYYNLKQASGLFLHFLTNGSMDIESRGSKAPLMIFSNSQQQTEFIRLLKQEEKQVFKKEPDFWSQQAKTKMTRSQKSVVDVLFLSRSYQFYNDYVMQTI